MYNTTPTRSPRVLVVDDHAVAREPLIRVLRWSGYDATGAANGAEALAGHAAAPADLVLLDLMMPKVDGVQFLEELRRSPTGRDVPVLVMTAMPDGSLTRRARELGVAGVLTKVAFNLDTLLDLIRVHARVPHQDAAAAPAAG
jgi:CheY-like chemotaxis protein